MKRATSEADDAPSAEYVARRWRLASIRTEAGAVPMPADTRAGLTFQAAGDLLADDGINSIHSQYTANGQDVWVTPGVTTLVGYVGDDPTQLLAIAAIGRLALGSEGGSNVHARIVTDTDTMEITVDEFTLRLRLETDTQVR